MSHPKHDRRLLWFCALLVAGATLAVTMLVQTVVGYRFVTKSILLQEARREGEQIVQRLDESLRWTDARDPAAVAAAVDDVWRDMGEQAAWIVVVDERDQVIAARGRQRATFTRSDFQQSLDDTKPLVRFESLNGDQVAVGAYPCRCSGSTPHRRARAEGIWNASYETTPGPSAADGQTTRGGRSRGPLMVELALYPGTTLPAPFARVRRQAAINALTACALLGALLALAWRLRSYVRGRQIEAQLNAAGRVQRELMPVGDARIPGVELALECRPASHVGGDLVDVLQLPGDRIGFMVGDVSGKGVCAALLMGVVQGAMRASAGTLAGDTPEQATRRVNDLLVEKTSGERFASLFWCAFDPGTATLRYVNAGHPPAFVVRSRSGVVEALTEGGPVLGVLTGAAYASGALRVAPGDLLVVYSDGIAEAADVRDQEFGADRIAGTVREHASSSARGICDAVLAEVGAFADAHAPRDDRTLLVVRFTAECQAFDGGALAA